MEHFKDNSGCSGPKKSEIFWNNSRKVQYVFAGEINGWKLTQIEFRKEFYVINVIFLSFKSMFLFSNKSVFSLPIELSSAKFG